jgi:ribonuclease D
MLDVKIDKFETRSNWVRRPLRDAQLLYAASDVEFLLDLHQKQLQELEQLGRFSWLQEELSYSKYKLECEENRKSIKSTHKLTKEQEKRFLADFNLLVQSLSESLKINKTLVFSKKSQKELLKFILTEGTESALDSLTLWRKELLLEKLLDLIKKYNLNF